MCVYLRPRLCVQKKRSVDAPLYVMLLDMLLIHLLGSLHHLLADLLQTLEILCGHIALALLGLLGVLRSLLHELRVVEQCARVALGNLLSNLDILIYKVLVLVEKLADAS